MEGGLERNHWVGHRGEALTSHNIPEVDEAVSPSSGQEAAVGAKMNSIHLREVGILWGKEKVGIPGPCHTSLCVHAQRLSLTVSVHTRGFHHLCLQQPPRMLLHIPNWPSGLPAFCLSLSSPHPHYKRLRGSHH